MNVMQFLRIFWARRIIVIAATIACLVGGVVVGLVMPPVWTAHAKVLMDLLKPDPVTGQVKNLSGGTSHGYLLTQTSLVTDPDIIGKVADDLDWVSDPKLIAQYNKRPKDNLQDFRTWIANKIIPSVTPTLIQGTNILDIQYASNSPQNALKVAGAIRRAYVDASLAIDKTDAAREADWQEQQADQAKNALAQAVAQKVAYERATGVVLQDNNQTIDEARLAGLASEGGASVAPTIMPSQVPPSSGALAQIDATIASQSKVLGPNHPELVALKARRAAIAAQVAEEQKQLSSNQAAMQAARAGIGAVSEAVNAQQAKVLSQDPVVARLRELESDVQIRTDEYNKAVALAVQSRQAATVAENDLTPLGPAEVSGAPDFPNWLLIIPGSLVAGLAIGVLTAFMVELFGRRVRGPEDLASSLDAPVLASIGRAVNDNANGRAKRRRTTRQRIIPA